MNITSNSPSKRYIPVEVKQSPAASKKNLTGCARLVRDGSALIFNSVQTWNNHHVSGLAVLEKIFDVKLSTFDKVVKSDAKFNENLQELCLVLDGLCKKMASVVDDLNQIYKQFEDLQELREIQDLKEPLFLTWQTEHFVSVSKEIAQCYQKEFELKNVIKETVAHAVNKQQIMYCCTAWVHQPFIDSGLEFKMESLLKETGHR